MRVMSREQAELLQQLVALARGDMLLVEDAIWAAAKGKESAKLSDIVEYIKRRVSASDRPEEGMEAVRLPQM
jgi:hypothetical protein